LAKQELWKMQENRHMWILKSKLVKDVIHGVSHQHHEKRFEQQKSDPNVHVADNKFRRASTA